MPLVFPCGHWESLFGKDVAVKQLIVIGERIWRFSFGFVGNIVFNVLPVYMLKTITLRNRYELIKKSAGNFTFSD